MTTIAEPTTAPVPVLEPLPPSAAVQVPLTHHRFTADEYNRLGEARIIGEDDRVELMDGEILDMCAIGYRHAAHVTELTSLLADNRVEGMRVSVQNPLDLGQRYQPQPDLMLLRERVDRYKSGLPTAADVLLLIEVADSSLDYDQHIKLPVYAQAGIAEVWIVNLDADQVEIYSQPQGDAYTATRVVQRGETVPIGALPAVTLHADDILL
ncbi:MAG: Uma2 family endonuclease [Chloroflexota bacterium]|nr:Uma2 family endonuclease [Chloroflexota bacterium]